MTQRLPAWPHRLLDRLSGKPVVWSSTRYDKIIAAINAREFEVTSCTDEELLRRAKRLRIDVGRSGGQEPETVIEGFALAREAACRALGLRPFDVQVLAGLALARRQPGRDADRRGQDACRGAAAFLNALDGAASTC